MGPMFETDPSLVYWVMVPIFATMLLVSVLQDNLMQADRPARKIEAIYLSMLGRKPTRDDLDAARLDRLSLWLGLTVVTMSENARPALSTLALPYHSM